MADGNLEMSNRHNRLMSESCAAIAEVKIKD